MIARAARFAAAVLMLVLFAASTGADAAPPNGAIVDITIQNFAYSPNVITLDVGDTVRWTNLDSAPHSAVSVEPGFVTVTLAQGQVTTTTLDRPGTFAYVCGVHGASMKGTVVVRGTALETPRATAAPTGHFEDASFAKARPDRLTSSASDNAVILYASAALALLAVARFAWLLRHP